MPALIFLGVMAVAGLRWRVLGWFVWIGGMALLALVDTGVGMLFAWMLGYPVALMASARRGRIARSEDAGGHLDDNAPRPVDPWVEGSREKIRGHWTEWD